LGISGLQERSECIDDQPVGFFKPDGQPQASRQSIG
jgi:hypothetical protein